jgi:hypothetical protein
MGDIQEALDLFVADGRLHRYSDGEHEILQIVTWWEHQKLQWAAPSNLPSPEGWTDRIRHRINGSYQAVDWDSPGGFTRTVHVNGSGEEFTRGLQLSRAIGRAEPEPEPEPEPDRSSPTTTRAVDTVHNSADPERGCSIEPEEPSPEPPSARNGDDPAASHAATTDNLEALRRLPTCEGRECAVRTLRVSLRGVVAQIVGPAEAGNLYNESKPLHRTLAGMAGYVCAACWKASAAEQVTMENRQPICRKALVAYVDELYLFHRQKPIRSLPAFLRTRYGHMTEAPVPDALLAELRALERTGTNGKSEPVRVGAAIQLPACPPEKEPVT